MTKNYRFLGLHLVTAQSKKVKVESSSNHVAQAARRPALFRLSWVLLAGNDTGFSPFCALQNVAFISHYFTARFISCSDTFVSIYPRLPLSYHESALGSQGTPTFLLLQSAFSHGFPMVFLSFSHGFPIFPWVFPWFSHFPMVFPWFFHFPMVFPMVFAHFVLVVCGRLLRRRQNFGDLSEDASMAAVVADLAQITEEHPYLTLGPRGETTTGPVPDLEEVHVYVKYMYDYVCMYIYNYLWLFMFIYVSIICIYIYVMGWNGMLCYV